MADEHTVTLAKVYQGWDRYQDLLVQTTDCIATTFQATESMKV